ncbi:hypothetical protein KI387_017082, partial [Taxus chinensis]
DQHEVLEATLHAKSIGSVDTGVSPFLEAQIVVMDKHLEKLSMNLSHETHSGIWCIDFEVEGHVKDSLPQRIERAVIVDYEICHGDHD